MLTQPVKIIFSISALCLSLIAHAQPTLLVFGDSLSAGYGIPRETAWVSLLQNDLKKTHPHYRIVNASISGETSTGGLRRIDAILQQQQPSLILLELGANDGLRGENVTVIEQNLEEIIRRCRAFNAANVLLIGIQLPPNYGIRYSTEFKSLYPRLAHRQHLPLVPFMLEGLTPEHFQADNLHPNAQAQPKILRNILPTLLPLLSAN